MLFKNAFWSFAEKIGCQAVSFIISIIIARLLEPSAYGVVAIVNALIQIFTVFCDTGFGSYIMQKKDPDVLDYSICFIANIVMCISLYTVIYFLAPLAANFYNNDYLTILIRVAGITVLVSSVKNIQHAYISRNMLFKKFFYSSLAGTVGAGIVGIYMAINGYGVWALVVSNLFDITVDTLVMCFSVEWMPRMQFSFERFKSIFSFSWKLIISRFIERIYNKLYHLVVGKAYTAEDLAYYEKGKSLVEKIPENTENIINSVMFPVMVNCKDDDNKLTRLTKQLLGLCTFLIFPILVGIYITSDTIVKVLLTEKWINIVPYIKILCIAELFLPLIKINTNVINAKGRSDIILKNEVFKKVFSLIVLFAALQYSVMAVVFTKVLVNLISYLIESFNCKKLIQYGTIRQLLDQTKSILACAIMAISVIAVSKLIIPDLPKLMIEIILGISVYFAVSILIKNESISYIKEEASSFKKKRDLVSSK